MSVMHLDLIEIKRTMGMRDPPPLGPGYTLTCMVCGAECFIVGYPLSQSELDHWASTMDHKPECNGKANNEEDPEC